MVLSFVKRMTAARRASDSDILLLMRPLMSDMPAPMHFHDDPFFPFSRDIINATRGVVCGYIFDFPAYMVHAGAGARALERSIAYAGPESIKVLHGPFVGSAYIPMIYENALGADAATLAFERDLPAYLADDTHGAFLVGDGEPVPVSIPTYWAAAGQIILADGDVLRVAGTELLYSDYGNDYANKCREAIEAWQP